MATATRTRSKARRGYDRRWDHGPAPERSLQQRMDALKKANDTRTRRAQLKRDLKARRANLGDVLVDPPAWLETAKVFDLMLAVPSLGKVKVNRILTQARISTHKTLGGLSGRQRRELQLQLIGR